MHNRARKARAALRDPLQAVKAGAIALRAAPAAQVSPLKGLQRPRKALLAQIQAESAPLRDRAQAPVIAAAATRASLASAALGLTSGRTRGRAQHQPPCSASNTSRQNIYHSSTDAEVARTTSRSKPVESHRLNSFGSLTSPSSRSTGRTRSGTDRHSGYCTRTVTN